MVVIEMNPQLFPVEEEIALLFDQRSPEQDWTRGTRPEATTKNPPDELPEPLPATGRVCAGTATVRSLTDMDGVLPILLDALQRHGFTDREIQGIQLAVREAIRNAIEHGHKGDPTRQVRIRYLLNPLGLLIQVEDEGAGFRPEWVLRPSESPSDSNQIGRGLRLMKQHMSEVRYNASGNCVTLVKRRGGSAEPG